MKFIPSVLLFLLEFVQQISCDLASQRVQKYITNSTSTINETFERSVASLSTPHPPLKSALKTNYFASNNQGIVADTSVGIIHDEDKESDSKSQNAARTHDDVKPPRNRFPKSLSKSDIKKRGLLKTDSAVVNYIGNKRGEITGRTLPAIFLMGIVGIIELVTVGGIFTAVSVPMVFTLLVVAHFMIKAALFVIF